MENVLHFLTKKIQNNSLSDQLVTSFQIPKQPHCVSEFPLQNTQIFGKSKNYGLSSLQKKSYSAWYTHNHIYQNQKTKFPWGLSTEGIWTKDVQMQIMDGEQKHTPGLFSSRVRGIHREGSFFTMLTLSSPPLWVCREAPIFLLLNFHRQSAHRKIFHHHKSGWPLLMLCPQLDKHCEILNERVKWIFLDIFHKSYSLLTFLCSVFLFWAPS